MKSVIDLEPVSGSIWKFILFLLPMALLCPDWETLYKKVWFGRRPIHGS